jgi:hypothetical protein
MLKMSQLYPRGCKVKNINIMPKWLKGYKFQHYAEVVKMLKMSTLYTSS